jgi:hypothetical protein
MLQWWVEESIIEKHVTGEEKSHDENRCGDKGHGCNEMQSSLRYDVAILLVIDFGSFPLILQNIWFGFPHPTLCHAGRGSHPQGLMPAKRPCTVLLEAAPTYS